MTFGLLAVPATAYALRALRRARARRVRLGLGRDGGEESISSTTLDPPTSEEWDALRENAHALLDAAINRLRSAKKGRVWTPVPDELKASLSAPLPHAGVSDNELRIRLESLLPFGVGNTHPRFFGWVHGAGSAGGLLPEMVAAAMNANCGGREHAAMYVERQVLAWARDMMGFPKECGALLVSGTSMATIVALKAARDAHLGFESSRKGGLVGAQGGRLVAYAAQGTHSCVKRALDVLGLGSDALRLVPVTADFTMDVMALDTLVDADVAQGFSPFLVVGTAGSVNVGAIDDLDAIADLARAKGLWFHVDGAFGAPAVLSDVVRPRLSGMERASSLAFDYHKWLHVNYDCGCVLIRDRDVHLRTFSERPDYLASYERGIAAGSPWPTDFGPELSRGFRALKVWSQLVHQGVDKLGAAISRNVEHASYLAQKVDAAPHLERLAPTSLQIVVFRYVPLGWGADATKATEIDALNDALVVELQESGSAAPSTTRIHGRLAIRVNITNHRTRFEDLDLLVEAVEQLGAKLAAGR